MEKMNQEMDKALVARVAALNANDDETGDGKIDLADLKKQLDRVEAQLELQDKQNRKLLYNQRLRFLLTTVLSLLLCIVVAVMWHFTNEAYRNVLETSAQVNALVDTLQSSLDTLDTEDLNEMMQTMPDLVDKLSAIDVDALNAVLTKLPALMDAVTELQTQFESIANAFSGFSVLLN